MSDEASFRPKLFIKPSVFERRLATLRRKGFRVLPLDEALQRLDAGSLPRDSVVITVDDGFHSVHDLAVPLLKRYGYPATVYVTTYYVQHANPVFRLAVQYMFWKTTETELRPGDCPWYPDRVVNLADPVQAEGAMWDCIRFGERHCTEEQRRAVCEDLGRLLGVPRALNVELCTLFPLLQ